MNNEVAIKVEHVSKKYCKSLKRSMLYGVRDIARNTLGLSSHSDKLRKDEFWAVNDVSFEVKKGETLGIIGPNGAGKTTLLKLLNGIFWPDKGKITVKGRVGALIQVGAGFHPLLTGRENIYINAAILGMTKKEVDEKFDEIIEFADIGDFLDTPVKFYSSGMFVRLGFAVAVHCEPHILLVDEVLAVGDINFQAKCFEKINQVKKTGVPIIIVSHQLAKIRQYCDYACLLNQGGLVKIGAVEGVCRQYTALMQDKIAVNINNIKKKNRGIDTLYGPYILSSSYISNVKFCFVDKFMKPIAQLYTKEFTALRFCFDIVKEINLPIISFTLYRDDGMCIAAVNSQDDRILMKGKKGSVEGILRFPELILNPGLYTGTFIVSDRAYHLYRSPTLHFQVRKEGQAWGFVHIPHSWEIKKGG